MSLTKMYKYIAFVYYPVLFILSGEDYINLSSVCQQPSDERQWIGRGRTVKVNMRFILLMYLLYSNGKIVQGYVY